MKYHLSAIAAVGALAAVSFAAPASADPIWSVNGSTNLVCESMTVSSALPPATGHTLFDKPAFNVRVLTKNGLSLTFNVPFDDSDATKAQPASFCNVLWTQLNEACERSNDNYSYGKSDKAFALSSTPSNDISKGAVGCPGLELGIDGTFTHAVAVQFTGITINSKIH